MSEKVEEPDLKGGHAPAVKVGAMRVVQHSHVHQEKQKREEKAKEEEEFQTEKSDIHTVVVSGAVAKGDKDFPPAAVKVAHEKPVPAHEKPPQKGPRGPTNVGLHQPQKFN